MTYQKFRTTCTNTRQLDLDGYDFLQLDGYDFYIWVHMASATVVACWGPLIPKEIDIQVQNILDL